MAVSTDDRRLHQGTYLAAMDALFAVSRDGQEHRPDEVQVILDSFLRPVFPELSDDDLAPHRQEALRFLHHSLRVMGFPKPMPGLEVSLLLAGEEEERHAIAFTGVVAVVIHLKDKMVLEQFNHWVLPTAQRREIESLLRDAYGLNGDMVWACQFPFQPGDLDRLHIPAILTSSLVTGVIGEDLEEADLVFRQAVLRRQPATRVWTMPDGFLAVPLLLPVTVISVLAPGYIEHEHPNELPMAEALGKIIATGMAVSEFIGCESEVYCGHLHADTGIAEVVDSMIEDLEERGGKATKIPYRSEMGHLGRNQVCPCGSGKKFKQCCAASARP